MTDILIAGSVAAGARVASGNGLHPSSQSALGPKCSAEPRPQVIVPPTDQGR
jgi:hypothetical protein